MKATMESKFFAEGYTAYKAERASNTCPYEAESWTARQRRAGWAMAQHEYEDEDGLCRA